MNKNKGPHYFYAMPFLNMGDLPEIDLGFAKIWNFSINKNNYIKDIDLLKAVEKMLNNYKDSFPYGEEKEVNPYPPLRGIGIIDIGVPTNRDFSYKERRDANDARFILFISFLSKNNTVERNMNTGHSMCSSENYSQVHLSVTVGNDNITEYTGFVIPSWHGGINIEKNSYIRPRHIPTVNFTLNNLDTSLLNSLLKLKNKKKKIFRKIITSIETFYESYFNSTDIGHNARILSQAQAFETLLCEENDNARVVLKNFLRTHGDYPEDRRYSYKSERPRGRKEREADTVRVIWADRFFTLRNHIIHGLLPKEEEYYFRKTQRHFDIALFFFIFCIKRVTEQALNKEIFNDDVVWKTWQDNLSAPPRKVNGFEYQKYGRRAWERIKKNI